MSHTVALLLSKFREGMNQTDMANSYETSSLYEELEDTCVENETEVDEDSVRFDDKTLLRVCPLISQFPINNSS